MGTFKDGGSAAGPTSNRLYLMWPKFRASAANYAGLLLFLDRGFEPAGLRRMLLLSPAQVATATQALCQTRGPSGGGVRAQVSQVSDSCGLSFLDFTHVALLCGL